MKKSYKLIDLDCANCAANDASVSFMSQRLTVDADDGRFEEIMKQVVKTCKKVEPDCTVQLS